MNGPSGLPGPPVIKIVLATDSTVKGSKEGGENVLEKQTRKMPTHPAVPHLRGLRMKKFVIARTAVKPLGNLPVIMGNVSILTCYVMAKMTVETTRMSCLGPVQES